MKFTLPIFFAAALAASSSAEAASFSFTKAEISEAKMISNGFFYLYEAAGVITHNNKDYDSTVYLECESDSDATELLCEGELDVAGHTADVELGYSGDKGIVYWSADTTSSALQTAAELWRDQVLYNVYESTDGSVRDGNWIGLPYSRTVLGTIIYWWVHESWLENGYIPPIN